MPDEERRRRRRRLILLLTPVTVSTIAGFVATALLPTLLQKDGGHPLALLALDARNRHLILTASSVDLLPYFLVAAARLLAVDPFTYLLGRWYGDAGIRWVEKNFASMQPTVAFLERLFRRAAPVAVALAPGAIICVLAGATGMAVPVFIIANVVGTVVRIALIRATGEVFSGPVDAIRGFFDRYIIWTTAASIILVVAWFTLERRAGRAGAETPAELAEELEREIEQEEEATGPETGPET